MGKPKNVGTNFKPKGSRRQPARPGNISGREAGGTSRFVAKGSERQHSNRDPNRKPPLRSPQGIAQAKLEGRFRRGPQQAAQTESRGSRSGVSGNAFATGGRRTRTGIRISLS